MKKTNVNANVYYKMTQRGERVWIEYHRQMRQPQDLPKPNAEGWHETQLWKLIAIFGPHIWMGCDMPIETEIQIELQ